MRAAMLGALAGAGLVMVAVGATADGIPGFGPRGAPYPAASPEARLIALSTVVDNKYQQVTVIDPTLRTMGIYQVDLASGDIKLCCVRNLHWDLQMDYYNGNGLLPPEVRSMLELR
jgi:hypothetical protein